jgi:Holliday junction resolvasome RuvABC endonuclease subunit
MNERDIIFSLDPGSIRSGFSVMKPPDQLIEAALLLPDKKAMGSEFRINTMCQDLWQLLDKHQPTIIIVEWTSGKLNQRRHRGSGQGLGVHGAAKGALWREAIAWRRSLPAEQQIGVKVIVVRENDWTNGVPKLNRQAAIAVLFPQYRVEQDSGGDIADAIGLAVWYLKEQLVRLAECIK